MIFFEVTVIYPIPSTQKKRFNGITIKPNARGLSQSNLLAKSSWLIQVQPTEYLIH